MDRVQFYTYGSDKKDELDFISRFPFDNRHDFVADADTRGVAVKMTVCNERCDKGVRRDVSLTLIDMTVRCETVTTRVKVNIRKDGFKDVYACLPSETAGLQGGHTYKLVVCDETEAETLTESVIHFFDIDTMGHPSEWYKVCDGGIRPAWKDYLYKSLNTGDEHDYYVRFNLMVSESGLWHQAIMPELEMRLYYPDGTYIKDYFKEPRCYDPKDYKKNCWSVEYLFETIADINGVFYAELLCMEYPIAGFVFDTLSATNIQGSWYGNEITPIDEYTPECANARINKYLPDRNNNELSTETYDLDSAIDRFLVSELNKSDDEAPADSREKDTGPGDTAEEPAPKETDLPVSLEHLTGLQSVKEKLTVYERVVRFNKMRQEKGLPVSSTPLHAMFLGSPGTGKTTVVKLMGDMLHRAGVLSKGHVVVRERATLLGQNYNSESEKTLAAIEEAQGGILFIDEAYQLYQPDDSRDPGKFVIETLLTALADESNRDWMLVLAGYPDEMKRMSDMNPGFKSRIPDSNIYTFDDFTEVELMEIAERYLARNGYTLTPDAQDALSTRLKSDYSMRDRNFGNARHVVNMIQTEILPSMAVRVIDEGLCDDVSLTEIQKADIHAPVVRPVSPRQRVGFAV